MTIFGRKRRCFRELIVFGFALVLLWTGSPTLAQTAPLQAASSPHSLRITWGPNGISNILHNGQPFLKPDSSGVQTLVEGVRFAPKAGGSEKEGKQNPTSHSFSAATQTESFVYEWGRISLAYKQSGDLLHCFMTVHNDTADSLSFLRVRLLTAKLPISFTNVEQNTLWNTDGSSDLPAIGMFDSLGGPVGISNWEAGRPVHFGLDWQRDRDYRELIVETASASPPPRHPVVDLAYFRKPSFTVAPKGTGTIHVSLTFGHKKGENLQSLCTDILKAYAAAHPFTLNWPDRRPIGALFLAQSNHGWKTNPRGYVFGLGEKEDVTTPEGRKAFSKELMAYGDRSVAILRQMGAQGVIVWDIEGQQYPHYISYVGEPDLLPQASPEMDACADAFFKKFRDAGLKVGVCIRPTQAFIFKPGEMEAYPYKHGGYPMWHRQVSDPGELMRHKIAYVKKRWGCTIIYLDSNGLEGFVDPKDGSAPQVSGVPGDLPLAMYDKALQGNRDVLLIPEHFEPNYWAFSAPYQSPNLQQIRSDGLARSLYPKSGSFIMTNYDLLRSNWSDYEQEVSDGSILSCNAWYPSAESRYIHAIYDTVDFKKHLPTVDLHVADVTALAALLKSREPRVRYAAARRLGSIGTSQALAALDSAVGEPDLAVRKEIIDAMASASNDAHRQYPQALQTLLRIAMEPSTDDEQLVQPFAAQALSRLPEVASRPLLDRLHKAGNTDVALFQTAATVFSALTQPSPETVKELIEQASNVSADMRIRLSAVKALGTLRAQQAEPSLITILNNLPPQGEYDWLGVAATEALGRIGDKSGIEPIIHDYKRVYGTVAVYAIPRVRYDALCSLTGTNQCLSADGWASWWNAHK